MEAEGGRWTPPLPAVPSPAAAAAEAAEAASDNAIAHRYVSHMRCLNYWRAELEGAGAVALLACPPGSPQALQSLHCADCQQLCFAATAVLAAAGSPAGWRHACLECAGAALAAQRHGGQPQAAQAQAQTPNGQPPAAQTEARQLGEQAKLAQALLFVKPQWRQLEACCRELEAGGVQELAGVLRRA